MQFLTQNGEVTVPGQMDETYSFAASFDLDPIALRQHAADLPINGKHNIAVALRYLD